MRGFGPHRPKPAAQNENSPTLMYFLLKSNVGISGMFSSTHRITQNCVKFLSVSYRVHKLILRKAESAKCIKLCKVKIPNVFSSFQMLRKGIRFWNWTFFALIFLKFQHTRCSNALGRMLEPRFSNIFHLQIKWFYEKRMTWPRILRSFLRKTTLNTHIQFLTQFQYERKLIFPQIHFCQQNSAWAKQNLI